MKSIFELTKKHVLSYLDPGMLQHYHDYVHHCPAKKISILHISNCNVGFLFQV